MNTGDSV